MSNLRPAPFHLRASVVRALIGDVRTIAKGMAAVELLPVRLADQVAANPEITRLDSSHGEAVNDDLSTLPASETGPRTGRENAGRKRCAQGGEASLAPQACSGSAELLEAAEASPHPINEPAAAQVGRAPDQGRDRANGSEEGNHAARPAESSSRVRKSRATGVKAAAAAARADRNKAMLEAYAEGAEVSALAEQFGLSICTVREIAQAAGLLRPPGKAADPQIAERNALVAADFRAGMQIAAMIAKFGLSRANIYKIAELAGAKRPAKAQKPPREPKPRQVKAPKPPRQPKMSRIGAAESAATASTTGDSAGLLTESPEGSSREVVGGPLDGPANASEQRAKSATAAVVRPAAVAAPAEAMRPAKTAREERVEVGLAIHAQQTAKAKLEAAARRAAKVSAAAQRQAQDDEAVSEFSAALARVRARRAGEVEIIAPVATRRASRQNEGQRLAQAYARKAAGRGTGRPAEARPKVPAPTREECRICGVPGWKGCDHWLPCEAAPINPALCGHPNSGLRG